MSPCVVNFTPGQLLLLGYFLFFVQHFPASERHISKFPLPSCDEQSTSGNLAVVWSSKNGEPTTMKKLVDAVQKVGHRNYFFDDNNTCELVSWVLKVSRETPQKGEVMSCEHVRTAQFSHKKLNFF